MNQGTAIKNVQYIVDQLPNPYVKNVWYDIELMNGQKVQARYTKPGFIHVRKWLKQVLENKDGEILSEKMDWSYFRINKNTGEVVQL